MSEHVLVTGADGFIGSHLVERLLASGCRVRALSQYNAFNQWGWLDRIAPRKSLEVVTGDIRDAHFCVNLARSVDKVFHLAALIGIPYSYVAPESYLDTNVRGTLNLCQAALAGNVNRFVHTSTSEVYGSAQYVPMDEAHPLSPQSPYSASKIAADAMAMSFYHAFGLPVVIARPFNAFGPRQSNRAVIPTIVAQALSPGRVVRLGDTSPTRDFTYVTDTCAALKTLGECDGAVGEVVNIGSGFEVSVARIVELVGEITGAEITVDTEQRRVRPAGSEVNRLWCNASKLESLTGIRPEIDFASGLRLTIDWIATHTDVDSYKSGMYTI